MLYKKSVVLSAVNNSLCKAVVNFNYVGGEVSGDVRLYNFNAEPIGVLTLAMLINGEVKKQGLTRQKAMIYKFNSVLNEIPAQFSCAVVESKEGNAKALLYGGTENANKLEESLIESLSVLEMQKVEQIKEKLNESVGEFENQSEIEATIDECMQNSEEDKCLKCKYKEAFYAEETTNFCNLAENTEKNITEKNISYGDLRLPKDNGDDFIGLVGGQIGKLFEKYPAEDVLNSLIPNSRWVKVDFNNDGKFYVIGLIYENEDVRYICYGVPALYSPAPPADFNPNAQFLPIDLAYPQGEGYWITYQDAISGNLVSVEIIE